MYTTASLRNVKSRPIQPKFGFPVVDTDILYAFLDFPSLASSASNNIQEDTTTWKFPTSLKRRTHRDLPPNNIMY